MSPNLTTCQLSGISPISVCFRASLRVPCVKRYCIRAALRSRSSSSSFCRAFLAPRTVLRVCEMARCCSNGGKGRRIAFSAGTVMVLIVVLGEEASSLATKPSVRKAHRKKSLETISFLGESRIKFAVMLAPASSFGISPTFPIVPLTESTISPSSNVVRGNFAAVSGEMKRNLLASRSISPFSSSSSPLISSIPLSTYLRFAHFQS